jgi:hypothetical protein
MSGFHPGGLPVTGGDDPRLQQQQQQQPPPPQSQQHSATSSVDRTPSKSPLSTFGIFRGLTGGDKKNRDGQPAKRRGPKPDAKPAVTRRQELNRQAQRTHRERKEIYVKALEQEVLHLKELYTDVLRERDAVREENRKLKEIMAMHGLNYVPDPEAQVGGHPGNTAHGGTTSGSVSGGYGTASASTGWSSPPNSYQGLNMGFAGSAPPPHQPQPYLSPPPQY